MKNLITDFGIFINENYLFSGGFLAEENKKGDSADISGLTSSTALIGSSTSKTTNKDAFSALLEGFKDIERTNIPKELLPLIYTSIKGKDGKKADSIDENTALIFSKGLCRVGPKTEKIKNYLKIGDEVLLNGDKGDLQVKDRKFGDIKKEGVIVEASGNGIFILGRLLKSRAIGAINDETKVYLGINLKKPMVIVANSKSGIQNKNPSIDIIIAMMGKKFFTPHKENFSSWAFTGRNLQKDEYKNLLSTLFDRTAVPTISSPDYSSKELNPRFLKIGDASSLALDKVFEGFKPENIEGREGTKQAISKLADIYVKASQRMVEPWVKLTGERFKYFYSGIVAKDTGAPDLVFTDINKQVDSGISKIVEKVKEIDGNKEWAIKTITKLFYPEAEGSSQGNPGADSAVSIFKQSEGKF